MAFDGFLKIPNINGESTLKGFEKWIAIESFSWGEERPPSGNGVAVPLEVQVVANTQASSPSLFAACANGEALGTVLLHLATVGGSQSTFFKWDLENAVIGSYRVGGNTADDRPADQFSISFTALTYSYSAQDGKGGAGSPITKSVTFQ